RHNDTGEDNADAHIKRQVMGREVVVAITDGKLDFGPWEQIFYGEFDGRRRKRGLGKIIGEKFFIENEEQAEHAPGTRAGLLRKACQKVAVCHQGRSSLPALSPLHRLPFDRCSLSRAVTKKTRHRGTSVGCVSVAGLS